MPTLLGHVVPGALLMTFGLWWSLLFFRVYFRCRLENSVFRMTEIKAYGQAMLNPSRRLSPFPPWECLIKVLGLTIGVLGEFCTSLDQNWHFYRVHSIQHMTIFSLFAFPSLFELLYYYRVPLVPPHLDLVAGMMAFGVQAISFAFHLHGRPKLDVVAHTFLIYSSIFVALALLFEVIRPRDPRPHLIRCCLIFAQGLWYVILGAVLYPPYPSWPQFDQTSHTSVMIITAAFVSTVPFVAVLQLLLGVFVYRAVKAELVGKGVRVQDKFVSYEIEDKITDDMRLDQFVDDGYLELCNQEASCSLLNNREQIFDQ